VPSFNVQTNKNTRSLQRYTRKVVDLLFEAVLLTVAATSGSTQHSFNITRQEISACRSLLSEELLRALSRLLRRIR
jgi:hypothetical protein